MRRLQLTAAAAEDIERLKVTHRLPHGTEQRIFASLRSIRGFPRSGKLFESGPWKGERYILGPWRWMIIVYRDDEAEDRIVVLTVQDGRSAASPTL